MLLFISVDTKTGEPNCVTGSSLNKRGSDSQGTETTSPTRKRLFMEVESRNKSKQNSKKRMQ